MIGLILGTLVSEIFFSGRLSDWIVLKLAKKNNNVRTPEMRLWLWYPTSVLVMIGLIVWGRNIDAGWHWIVGQISWFLCIPKNVYSNDQLRVEFRSETRSFQVTSIHSRHMLWK